jgi:hypothetical protein
MAPAEYAKAVNEIRTTLLQGLGGAVLLAGVYVTYQQLQTTREGQVTERFTRAVEQLASERLAIQLGGVAALDRIAAESPRDRKAIVDVLAAAIRTRSPWPPPGQSLFPADHPIAEVPPLRVRAPSVQSALNVVGRWGPTPAQEHVWPMADLAGALQEAMADATTWWPSGFQPLDAGVVVQRTASGGGAT